MLRHPRPCRRGGSAAAEFAIVLPVLMLLLIGLIVGGLGVFRYQQVANLAREGARWASVHGGQYQQEGYGTAATPADVYNNAILPKAVGLTPAQLGYTVTWAHPSKMPLYFDAGANQWRKNNVTVTVTYQWIPEVYFATIPLTSTSVMPVTY